MSKVERIPGGIDIRTADAVPVGAVPYGTVFTDDGELDDVKSVDRSGVEALHGVPAPNWRGLTDPSDDVLVPAPPVKRGPGRPKKTVKG